MPFLGLTGLPRDPTTGALLVSGGGSNQKIASDTPEAHGAKRDGVSIADAAMTNGSAVLTSATGLFTANDVGKVIIVRGAGVTAGVLSTTILSYQSATQVTLAAASSATLASTDALYGTDDTAAITAAIAAAVAACQADRSYYCEVAFSAGIYVAAAATTKGGATLGNAQIPLPVVMPKTAGEKVTLVLKGLSDAAAITHWNQAVPQASGSIIASTLVGQTPDGTWGSPSIIGGPTTVVDATGPADQFSNMRLVAQGVTLLAPYNPSVIGLDARRLAQCDLPNFAALAHARVTTLSTKPTNTNGIGVYLPRINNNDSATIGTYACEGFYYGLGCSDHLVAARLLTVYCNTGIFLNGGSTTVQQHGFSILYWSCEACATALEVGSVGAGEQIPVFIGVLDCEVLTGTNDITDTTSVLRGEINMAITDTVREPKVSGGAHVRINNVMRPRGAFTATLPTSGAASTVIFRDQLIHISGGTVTVVAVDGITLPGVTSGPILVPAGKTFAITYSVAPTLTGFLL